MRDQNASTNELFTIEESHGKARLTAPRPSDLGAVPTETERGRDHDARGRFKPGNRAQVGKAAKRALTAPCVPQGRAFGRRRGVSPPRSLTSSYGTPWRSTTPPSSS